MKVFGGDHDDVGDHDDDGDDDDDDGSDCNEDDVHRM